MLKKYLFLSLLVLSLLVSPLIINAQTPSDVAGYIAELRRQIAVLQEQLARLQGNQSGGWCHNFNKNLGVGINTASNKASDDVWLLHIALKKEGFSVDADSSSYSENTTATVSAFQLKYKNEILTPNGLANPTGYVGPATRAKLNQLYGCGRVISGNRPPIISGVSGPTTLNVNQTATWTVEASDPENGTLNYSVTWGDEARAGTIASSPTNPAVQQTATFTHSYERAGTYNPIFVVTDNSGQSARTSLSITVGQTTNRNITVLTPNGGEQWVANSTQAITWRYNGATSGASAPKVDLYLDPELCVITLSTSCPEVLRHPYVLDRDIPVLSIYNWIVATDIDNRTLPSGSYKVRICEAGSQTNCDSSDNYFTIAGGVAEVCINSTLNSFTGPNNIKRGSIIVSFNDGVSLGQAQTTISGYGLTSVYRGSDWPAHEWLLVYVPNGEEAKWVCTLKGATGVQSTELNGIINYN